MKDYKIYVLLDFAIAHIILGPEIILVRGCENVAGMLRQKW